MNNFVLVIFYYSYTFLVFYGIIDTEYAQNDTLVRLRRESSYVYE